MNLNSFIIEQALKQIKIPDSSLAEFKLVSALGDVDGGGFPSELFELSAPMIIRGLLNFSVLQMNRDWVYPFWVHQQLDPLRPGYVARSQNPLLINITNRTWTALGSPTGLHEAIVDPRGLLTPLPREWSIDIWLAEDGNVFFPSLSEIVQQRLDTRAPRLTTTYFWRDLRLESEAFVGSVRGGKDVAFCQAKLVNASSVTRKVKVCVAIRPFGPEGVAPIKTIEFKTRRIASVDGVVGVVFAQEPSGMTFGNSIKGDAANQLRACEGRSQTSEKARGKQTMVKCDRGLAHTVATYDLMLGPAETQSIYYSIALGTNAELERATIKGTWRVSYDRRREEQQDTWKKELEEGADFQFGHGPLQELFDANRLALMQLHDGDFISPGPYLYHRFWFRDAAPMLRALDVLGFSKRVRQVIDGFPSRLTSDGFFRAPGGEWDSNGAVLWTIYQHFRMTRSLLWLKQWYPLLAKAGRWIVRMRRRTETTDSTHRGLMPKSLSAEHLGTVDQYYWDSFWSLAGLKALCAIAREVQQGADVRRFEAEVLEFENDVLQSFRLVEQRLGERLIPSAPLRAFDESAIGSICSIYPLNLFDTGVVQPEETVRAIVKRFVDDRGFFHPIIHSGYNPYLTLQLAHSLLLLDSVDEAWKMAESVFRQASPSYAFPEAIHPKTGGGSMGDGHHGWAAAEVVLFLRACLLQEVGGALKLFAGAALRSMQKGSNLKIRSAPTSFGKVSVSLEFESSNSCHISFSSKFFPKSGPSHIDLHLPWRLKRVSTASPQHLLGTEEGPRVSRVRFSPEVTTALIQIED